MAEATAAPTETPTETPAANTDPSPTPAQPEASPETAPSPEDAGTLATTEPEEKPQAVPATWPDDWRQRFSGANEDDLKTLNRYKTPDGIWKSYKAMRTKMDSGDFRLPRPEGDNDDALAQWRTEIGVPEAPKDYLEGLELQIPEQDQPYIDLYLDKMHQADVPKNDVAQGLKVYYEVEEAMTQRTLDEDRSNRNIVEDELRSEWGPEYRGNLQGMHAMLDAYGGEGLKQSLFEARMPGGRPLGDDPGVLKFLVNVAAELNPSGGTVTPVAGQTQTATIEAEISSLESEMHDTRARSGPDSYWNSQEKQARLRELYDLQERLQRRG